MNIVKNEIVVLDIAGAYARLTCGKYESETELLALGFIHEGEQMVRPISDDADRRNLVSLLIELDSLFASGRDWSPAELVDLYRDQGTISTGYRMIAWRNPSQYLITNR